MAERDDDWKSRGDIELERVRRHYYCVVKGTATEQSRAVVEGNGTENVRKTAEHCPFLFFLIIYTFN